MAEKTIDYEALSNELDTILAALQQADGDVPTAMRQYERGLEIIKQLESYLKTAETKVTKLKAQFGAGK